MRRVFVRSILPALLLVGSVLAPPALAADADPPVLYIHGFIGSPGCPGIDTSKQAAPLASVLTSDGYTGKVIGIDWLCGDKGGADIKPFGRLATNSWNATARIEEISYAFAWFVWQTYSSKGVPVNVAGHSMGGLIASYAVKHAGSDPAFPPALLINRVVTYSTPYAGLDKNSSSLGVSCGGYIQCQEMTPGSAFLKALVALPKPAATWWTTIGGSPKDIMTFASSAATDANVKIEYFDTKVVNYGHSAYLTDTIQTENVTLRLNGATQVGGHSLRMGWRALAGR